MHTSFWFDSAVGDLLFPGYTVSSTTGLVATCLGLASLAVLFEAVKVYQAAVKQKAAMTDVGEMSALTGAGRTVRMSDMLVQMLWFVTQDVLAYLLMMSVMTYNGYLTLSICLGAGVGYLAFGPMLMEIGLRTRVPKSDCLACRGHVRQVDVMSEVARGLLDSVMPDGEGGDPPQDGVRAVVEDHRLL